MDRAISQQRISLHQYVEEQIQQVLLKGWVHITIRKVLLGVGVSCLGM